MGRNIKYNYLKEQTEDKEFLEIIEKLYDGRKEGDGIWSCDFDLELKVAGITGDLKDRFIEFMRVVRKNMDITEFEN